MASLAETLIQENIEKHQAGLNADYLDIGNCGLKNELPALLGKCYWLKSLNLGKATYDFENRRFIDSINQGPANQLGGCSMALLSKLPLLETLDFHTTGLDSVGFAMSSIFIFLSHL